MLADPALTSNQLQQMLPIRRNNGIAKMRKAVDTSGGGASKDLDSFAEVPSLRADPLLRPGNPGAADAENQQLRQAMRQAFLNAYMAAGKPMDMVNGQQVTRFVFTWRMYPNANDPQAMAAGTCGCGCGCG